MAVPAIAVVGIGLAVTSGVASFFARRAQQKKETAALKNNALVQLGSSLSALGARGREEVRAARQQRRLGRRASAVLEASAKAAGASAGTGSVDAVQDVAMGEAEFVGSIDANLAQTEADLARRKKGTFENFYAANIAAEAQLGGPENDFLDFANMAASAINTYSSLGGTI